MSPHFSFFLKYFACFTAMLCFYGKMNPPMFWGKQPSKHQWNVLSHSNDKFFSTSLSQQNTNLLSWTISYYFRSPIRRDRRGWIPQEKSKLCHNLVTIEKNCSKKKILYNKYTYVMLWESNSSVDSMRQRLVVQGHHSWLELLLLLLLQSVQGFYKRHGLTKHDRVKERERKKGRSVLCRSRWYKKCEFLFQECSCSQIKFSCQTSRRFYVHIWVERLMIQSRLMAIGGPRQNQNFGPHKQI